MPAFFMSLLAALVLTAGARDQRMMADLAGKSNSSLALLFVGWLVATVVASFAAVAALVLAPMLTPNARLMFLAIALLLAAFELCWMREDKAAKEPTQSLFAIAAVLLWRQGSDGARFVLLGLAVLTGNPWLVALGGAVGGAAALTFAWSSAETYKQILPWRIIRIALAVILTLLAVTFAANARGIV